MRTLSLAIACIFSSISVSAQVTNPVRKAQIDTLALGVGTPRALAIDGQRVWFGSNQSSYGYYDLGSNELVKKNYPTKELDFRAIATTTKHVYLLNTSTPAYLVQLNKQAEVQNIVYQESHKNTFFDAMLFWDDLNGIAIGDPTSTCLSILRTKDGGANWQKIPCENLPDLAMGEAAFAASNTNIAVQGKRIWIATGGKHARILQSEDGGESWELLPTPIVANDAYSGIFTLDFYDEKRGIIAGGNYERPNSKKRNKAITKDGGLTWDLVANGKAFGYASCVRYLPNSDAKEIVTVGASGVYYSQNGGEDWTQLANDYGLVSFVAVDEHTLIATGKNRLVRIKLKRD